MRSHLKPELQDDEACVLAIAAGSARAFKAVMDSYMRDVFRFAYSMMADQGHAEDITQETFVRLWTLSGNWKPNGRLKSWLLKVAHNLCIDEMRRTRGHVTVDDVALDLVDTAISHGEAFGRIQDAALVRDALFTLPERQRTALMLVHYHECTNIEAAEIMALSVDGLESLLARGRKALRGKLKSDDTNLLG